MILQKLSFYRGIFDLWRRASKPIPLQFLLMGFSIMILLLRHSCRWHTFNSLFHDTYACVAIIGSGHKRSSGWKWSFSFSEYLKPDKGRFEDFHNYEHGTARVLYLMRMGAMFQGSSSLVENHSAPVLLWPDWIYIQCARASPFRPLIDWLQLEPYFTHTRAT